MSITVVGIRDECEFELLDFLKMKRPVNGVELRNSVWLDIVNYGSVGP